VADADYLYLTEYHPSLPPAGFATAADPAHLAAYGAAIQAAVRSTQLQGGAKWQVNSSCTCSYMYHCRFLHLLVLQSTSRCTGYDCTVLQCCRGLLRWHSDECSYISKSPDMSCSPHTTCKFLCLQVL
jgi:hypothetical protein